MKSIIGSALTLILLGIVIVLIGAYLKIQGHGNATMLVGLLLELFAIILFIVKYYKRKAAI